MGMKNILRALGFGLAVIACFQLLDGLLNELRARRLPKNFSVVAGNVLYRSGQMRNEHFADVITRNRIRTVVCLNPGDSREEPVVAGRLGVEWVALPMPGDGLGRPELFHQYLRLLADPDRRPLLVHCNAGAYRTGVSVALYRMLFEGWTLEDAITEMEYSGCKASKEPQLVAHLKNVYETIPADLRLRVALAQNDANGTASR